jgi:hypothetical protein
MAAESLSVALPATSEQSSIRGPLAPARTITLLDLVSELVDAGGTDREVVAAVLDLVETGRVRLVGQVREADLGGG